jgi:hypothetical protein
MESLKVCMSVQKKIIILKNFSGETEVAETCELRRGHRCVNTVHF